MQDAMFTIILLSIVGGGMVCMLIELSSCRKICNNLMKNIKSYIRKSEKNSQMELPLKFKKKQQVHYLTGKRKKKKSAKK